MQGTGYRFDRPVIIVSASRSGSTLLFETMSRSRSLWSIGDESHGVFERIDKLNPQAGGCDSNRLDASHADPDTVDRIRSTFFQKLRDSEGQAYREAAGAPRLLEKTPKNSLRIPFLNEVFPDALYIYLYRDPRENISSIMEAWRSQLFVTYPGRPGLPGWHSDWSLLLPPGYQDMQGKPLEEIAAFQWQAANDFILEDLEKLSQDRWTTTSYADLIGDAAATVARLCQFADIPFDAALRSHSEQALPLSRYTATSPRPGKWRMNEPQIERVITSLESTVGSMERAAAEKGSGPVLLSGPIREDQRSSPATPIQRNERCPCGSGLRFKHCHGKLEPGQKTEYGIAQ